MKVIDVLQKFLTFQKHPDVRKVVLLALPLLIDKTDADILTANDSKDIINILKMAHETWECKNHTHEGFSIIEILKVLHNLCKNEKIRVIFLNNNILDFIIDILQNGVSEQKAIAALILLELAFNPESIVKIKENKKLVEVLRKITTKKEYEDNSLMSVSIQVLYLIGASENPEDSPIKGHIMISYCHADKDTVEKVVKTLQEKKLTVWVDTQDMAKGNGDIYDTMAKAVQNAQVVVVFMSEAYTNSENCKFEAEYATRLKKKKIFVKVQEKFVPTDWLGLLAGNNLYHDFAGKVPHDQVMNNLIAAILYEYNQVI
ncbi:uncharacterized protein LOC131951063 [Physella acuta]|uniref:uncharacterized protein LOC131951063 n=1 Tax=Physella acuta TaxID=109671 RepID=UPI0027DC2257|nr:uncharacterized protein LOC131951063 [Physella acuta]